MPRAVRRPPDVAQFGPPFELIGPPLLTEEQVQALRARGIHTTRDLWRRLGRDRRAGIERIARKTGVPAETLTHLVAIELADGMHRRVALPWFVRSGQWLHLLLRPSLKRLGGPAQSGNGWTWITEAEVEGLRIAGIRTLDDLWSTVGRNLSTGIRDAADGRFFDAERLRDLLAAQGAREAGVAGSPRAVRWGWTLGPIVLVAAAAFLTWLTVRQVLPQPFSGTGAAPQVVVQVAGGIQPLHIIGASEVVVRSLPAHKDAFGAANEVVGRIARTALVQNEVITGNALFSLCPA